MSKKRVLIVDDEAEITKLVTIALSGAGYEVTSCPSGEEALALISVTRPDAIILDVMMPGMSGFDVCKHLKADRQTNRIPILMLTARSEISDIVNGIKIGADDYLTKPFDYNELIMRTSMVLRRIDRARYASPLTGLPGNVSIEQEIINRLKTNESFSVCYIDLDNFKAYNDNYGYSRGDTVISTAADIISSVVEDFGQPSEFVGHIGGDDFIIVSTPELIEKECQEIIKRFDHIAPSFYTDDDRQRGYINGVDRDGNPAVYPFVALSLAVVSNKHRSFSSNIEVSETAAELKKQIKLTGGIANKSGSRYMSI